MGGKKIAVRIDKLGRPTVEAIGFNGVGCTEATKSIEEALAGNVGIETREFKPEYDAMETEGETAKLHW